jgi:hypothetical protein
MAAIVKTESQFNPLAININAGAKLEHQPASKEEAVVTAKWLIANNYNIDLGLGQVNSANLAKTNLSIEDAFDSCKNLSAAATILQWNYASASKKISGEQAALHAAISAYNTGSFNRASEEQAAVAKYAALKTAFSTRDTIMARAGDVSHPQVVADGADKHIVDAILSGHIATLNIATQQIPEHQTVEQQHELQG